MKDNSLTSQTTEPNWTLGILSENRNGMTGISAQRLYNRHSSIDVWWSANATGSEIADQLRELANTLTGSRR